MALCEGFTAAISALKVSAAHRRATCSRGHLPEASGLKGGRLRALGRGRLPECEFVSGTENREGRSATRDHRELWLDHRRFCYGG